MNVSKNTNAIKILIFLLIAGAIAGIIIAITNSDSETKITPSPPDIEAKWVAVGNDGVDRWWLWKLLCTVENGKIWTETSSGDSFRDATAITLSPVGGYRCSIRDLKWGLSIMGGSWKRCRYQLWKYYVQYRWKRIGQKTSSGDSFTGSGAYGYGVAYGTSNGVSPLWVAVGSDGTHGGYGRYYAQ